MKLSRRKLSRVKIQASKVQFLLKDNFITSLAAESVNGSNAEPGPGTRVVVDSGNNLSISGGMVVFAGGVGGADPAIWNSQAITRVAGKINVQRFRVDTKTLVFRIGLATSKSGALNVAPYFNSNGFIYPNSGAGVFRYGDICTYTLVIIMRSTGVFMFLAGGQYDKFRLINWTATSNASLYAGLTGNTGKPSYDLVGSSPIGFDPWLPVPTISDGFGGIWGSSDGLGHLETSGLGSGGSGVVYASTSGTWANSAGTSSCTVLGSGLGLATFTANTHILLTVNLVRSAGNAGIYVRYVDANNFIKVYHDGTNCKVDKVIGGITTNVASVARTYSANAQLLIWLDGTEISVVYNNAGVAAQSNIPDAVLQTSAVCGLYTTDTGATFDNLLIYPNGKSGEYGNLNKPASYNPKALIVCDGDSLTLGYGVAESSNYPNQLSNLLGRSAADIINDGASAETVLIMIASAPANIDWTYGLRPKNVVVLWGGRNDLASGIGNADDITTYNRIVTYCQARQAAGWKVIVCTLLPTTSAGANYETYRQSVNTSIRANYATFADAVADLGADSTIGLVTQNTNLTYYQADQIHTNAAGDAIVAGLVLAAYKSI